MEILKILNTIFPSIVVYMLINIRLLSFFSVFALFRQDIVSPRISIALSAILAFYLLLLMPKISEQEIFSFQFFLTATYQSVIGFISGITINIVFEIFSVLGQFVSSQIGLNVASLFDPKFGMITSLTHFYLIFSMTLFFLLNGHLIVINTLATSFTIIPLEFKFDQLPLLSILKYANVIFLGAVSLSITVFVVILTTNISLAIMTKFAPQFNLFSIGLNMSLILGLVCIYASFGTMTDQGCSLMEGGLQFFKQFQVELVRHVR